MAKHLPLTHLPHPILRKKAALVDVARITTPAFQRLLRDMEKTMHLENGVGLAAPQVGISEQFFVMATPDGPVAFINPRITRYGGKKEEHEGCLSIPGVWGDVYRATEVDVVALDRNGQEVKITAKGLAAHILQHETDHLNGILYIDRAHRVDKPKP